MLPEVEAEAVFVAVALAEALANPEAVAVPEAEALELAVAVAVAVELVAPLRVADPVAALLSEAWGLLVADAELVEDVVQPAPAKMPISSNVAPSSMHTQGATQSSSSSSTSKHGRKRGGDIEELGEVGRARNCAVRASDSIGASPLVSPPPPAPWQRL